ncbi:hypothetical protein Tco_0707560 [Tanacetum coccineum]|uniref:Uncharacterized protein n=1 Tax=Tanacetum coccineum TaxID=301880 RepID=A0ABQ4YAI2_9ASTR
MVAHGPSNIVARRVTDDLIAYSGETAVPRYIKFFLDQKIAESRPMGDQDEVHDSLLAAKDAKRCEENKLLALNDVIAEALDDIDTQEDLCFSLRISLRKKRRLVAELEALVERGDAAKPLEQMREIVARDSMTLGDLEKLLARALVGVSLKDGYVADMEEKK